MTPRLLSVVVASLCVSLAACGGSPTAIPVAAPAKPSVTAPVARPAAPVGAVAKAGPATSLVPPAPALADVTVPTYEPKGRRDPFAAIDPTPASGGLSVASTRLTGIVRGRHATLALVETSDGLGYILKPGDTLGDGRLLEIGADSAVFAVTPKPGSPNNRVVLKLAAK